MGKKDIIFQYGVDELNPFVAMGLANGVIKGTLTDEVRTKLKKCQEHVEKIVAKGESVYGINTGFGPCVGVGKCIPEHIAKLMMILKVHSLCFGYSGIAPKTIERILWMIENDVIPLVPSQGSVGASGDLAPLAHLFLPLIGVGKVEYQGKICDIKSVYKKHDLSKLTLGAKEGLALINGTQFIAAHSVDAVIRLFNCLEAADIIGALSLEAMLGSHRPFKQKLHGLRPFAGAQLVAARLTKLLEGSELVASHQNCDRVQDPYSLRCMPQVHGTSRDAFAYIFQQLLIELNSVTDNPVVFSEKETISGGCFHGQPLALPMDYACLAASELGSISERRTYLLLEGKEDLPMLLMKDTGINSGFMIPQYTAAALASENKTLCSPASVDSIPTSVGQEDHVSMGSISARKACQVIDNLENILAVELLCATQALDYRRPLKSSNVLESCHQLVRQRISHAEKDRVFGDDLRMTSEIIACGELVGTANDAARKHGVELEG